MPEGSGRTMGETVDITFKHERMPKEMKAKNFLVVALVLFLTISVQSACASGMKGDPAEQPGDTRVIRHLVAVTATIEALNVDTRVATLRIGDEVATVAVDERVKRLNEFSVGDKVRAEYYISLASEIREPTAEELDAPLTVLEGAAKARPGTPPKAGGVSIIKAVTTVVEIDKEAERVTLEGPLGGRVDVQVIDPSRLDKVSLGSTVVVTYTEAAAIALEKAE